MKNVLRFFTLLAFVSVMASCGGDTCYECTGDDTLLDLGTICEGDDNNGTPATSADIDAAVKAYEALGGTCNKK